MTSDEIKQARKQFSMTAKRFAATFGIGDERTVRRYENGSTAIPGPLDRLVSLAIRSDYVCRSLDFTEVELTARHSG